MLFESHDYYGVLFDCPAGERLVNCPMRRIEHFSIRSRILWFESLSHLEKREIIEHHIKCSKERWLKKVLTK